MKRILVVFYLLTVHPFLKSQISMQTNLPPAVPLNAEITFDVKIKKGATSHFAKYQMEVPRGAIVKEVDSKSGSFTFEDNIVKIIWVMAPVEPEFGISMKLQTGVVPGKRTFVQKYFYVENEDKKEVEMDPLPVVFKDSASAGTFTSSSEFITLSPKAIPSLLTTTINAAEISTKNPELLKQQVFQLMKDSRDAFQVGEREKKKAELKLEEANEAIAKAETLTDETEKKEALDKANVNKQKAENDLEVASRVLVLAKSLEDNAKEIDAINRSINPGSFTYGSTASAPKSSGTSGTSSSAEAATGSSAPEKTNLKPAAGESSVTETGIVFKIQLGAFSKQPLASDFRKLGKVNITSENGMYKVLYGSFGSKEEAIRKRAEIISKGFDGFVVSYQNGVRVK